MNKELQEIKANIEKLDREYRQAKGYGDVSTTPSKNEMEDRMYQMMSNIYRYIDSVASDSYKWQDNHNSVHSHLPKLTASQMEDLLDSCGAGRDFEVRKPAIFAKDLRYSLKGKEIILEAKDKD